MDEPETDENSNSAEASNKILNNNSTQTLDSNSAAQVIIVADNTSEDTNQLNANIGEPPAKRLCFAHDSVGHTYVLTLNAEGLENLQNTSTCSDLEQRLQAAVPHIAIESSSNDSSYVNESINQAWFTSREDKSLLQTKVGHMWKQGMWSKDEVEHLQNNISQYCKDHDIADPAEVIFEMTKDERKDFYRTIAKGLNRPLFSVYRRVIRMYDNKNHQGKYSAEELELLKELRAKHGNDWASIGLALGRSASSVKDRCRLMKETCNTGKWLPEEENHLTEAVYELTSAMPGESVTQGLSWAAVAERVGTRSEKQCRTKWLNYLNWKQTGGSEWTREDDISLVVKVYTLNVNDENQIDWLELSKDWPSVRSPQWLRGKWWSLKRHISNNELSFREIVDTLHKYHTQNIRIRNNPDGIRNRTSLSQPRVNVLQTPSLVQLPVQVQSEGISTIATTVTATDHTEAAGHNSIGTTYQAFEVIPSSIHLTPTGTPTFLIAQPSPVIPFSTAATNSEPIILQALPADSIQGNDNVTVQVNASSQIIISTSSAQNCVDVGSSLNVQQTIGQSDEDINNLEQSDQVNSPAEEINQSELASQTDISSQTDLDTSNDVEIKDEIEESDINREVSQSSLMSDSVEPSDLVMVSSASLQFVQSSSGDGELIHMSSFSGKQVLLECELLGVDK